MTASSISPSRFQCFCLSRSIVRENTDPLNSITWLDSETWSEDDLLDGPKVGLDSLGLLSAAFQFASLLQLQQQGLEELPLRARSFAGWTEIAGEAWRRGIKELEFRTSGSTGTPRPILHRKSDLDLEANAWLEVLPNFKRLMICVPTHHIYGFIFGILLPAHAKTPCIDALCWSPHRIIRELRPGDLVISHPAHWKLLSEFVTEFPSKVSGISSSGPISQELAKSLKTLRLSQLFDIFGSTETGGIGFRDAFLDESYQLCPNWTVSADGLALIRNNSHDSIELPDRIRWLENHRFIPIGRQDKLVQVAGHNVSLEFIANRLRCAPGVIDCKLRHIDKGDGGRLRAFVQVDTNETEFAKTLNAIKQWCHSNLPRQERPTSITIGNSIPRNSLGKAIDWV